MYGLKVIIVGAGIGGLTTGIALKQAGYEVSIYERVSKLRPAGAGISLWSNGVKVLNRLGLGDEMAAIGGQMNRMEYRSHRDESLSNIDLQPLFGSVGTAALSCSSHRFAGDVTSGVWPRKRALGG